MALEKTDREAAQKNIAENRKAYHDYHILETFETGVVLLGTEVKSIREGRVNLRDSYAEHDPLRRRKLLLHANEIRKLVGKTIEKGMTLVPLRMYFKDRKVKMALGLAKGKQLHDKRETIKQRETERETRAAVKRAR
jgi:SsrA-binding protein